MADQPIELMPLDTLHADAAYLVGRAVNGSMEPDEVVAVIRSRIDAARDALAAQGQDAEPVAYRCDWTDGPTYRQYHDDSDPLPTEWDEPPQSVTPLYLHPPSAQAEQPVNSLPYEEALSELIDKIDSSIDSGDILADARQASGILSKRAEPVSGADGLPYFAHKIIEKLARADECFSEGEGADIGRHWLDMLTQLGLLNRVQINPAIWEITVQGEEVLHGHSNRL